MVHSASPWLTGDITDQCFFAASSNAGDLLSVVRGFQACCSRRHQCSGPAPDVAIVQPATRTAVATDLIEVEARIRDRGKGVGRIEWRVNRITAAVATKPEGAEGKFTIIRQLALDPGDNIVEVAAYNDGNLLASTPARTTVKLDRANETEKPTLHVLAIGINSYVDEGSPMAGGKVVGFLPLSFAANDAKALADAMKRAGAGAYAAVKVTELLDAHASAFGVQSAIDRMASRSTRATPSCYLPPLTASRKTEPFTRSRRTTTVVSIRLPCRRAPSAKVTSKTGS